MSVKEYEVTTIDLITLRRQFYRRQFHSMFVAVLLSTCVCVFLSFLILHLYREPWRPVYFPTNIQGFPKIFSPNSQPMYSEDHIMEMADTMVRQSLSLDYVAYRIQLARVRDLFYGRGWFSFRKVGLEDSGFLERLLLHRQVTYTSPAGKISILKKGMEGGVFVWYVYVPVVVHFINTKTNDLSLLPLAVTIKIARVQPYNQPTGVGIVFVQGSET